MNTGFLSKYKVLDKLGEGSFSEVLRCKCKSTSTCYAAKKLKKHYKNAVDVSNCPEIVAMKKLCRHPNVVFMLEYHYDPTAGSVVLIFELMDMSIYDLMKQRRSFPEFTVRNYLYQLVKALFFIHSHGLFHRDIKPENILVKISQYVHKNQSEVIKLADFGSVRGITSRPPFTEYISTRWYRSPECLLTVGQYGPKMDVWATGCVFYEMLTMKALFPGDNEIDQLAKIHEVLGSPSARTLEKMKHKSRNFVHFKKERGKGLRAVLPSNITEESVDILKLMVQYDPDLRISVRRLLEHSYFRSLREDDARRSHASLIHSRSRGDHNSVPRQGRSSSPGKKHKKPKGSKDSSSSSDKTERSRRSRSSKTSLKKKQSHTLHKAHPLPLIGQKIMKSWGVDPAILQPKEKLGVPLRGVLDFQTKLKLPSGSSLKPYEFSKTTSYLPQIKKYYGICEDSRSKEAQFLSKSFVLPHKLPGQYKIAVNQPSHTTRPVR